MVVVESIPQHVQYKANGTFGIPLEKAWKELLSIATEELEVVSFYWTLTGNDSDITSSSDRPVGRISHGVRSLYSCHTDAVTLTTTGAGNPRATSIAAL